MTGAATGGGALGGGGARGDAGRSGRSGAAAAAARAAAHEAARPAGAARAPGARGGDLGAGEGAGRPLDLGLVLEPGFPYGIGPWSDWTADLLVGIAPLRAGVTVVLVGGDGPRAFVREVPRNVMRIDEVPRFVPPGREVRGRPAAEPAEPAGPAGPAERAGGAALLVPPTGGGGERSADGAVAGSSSDAVERVAGQAAGHKGAGLGRRLGALVGRWWSAPRRRAYVRRMGPLIDAIAAELAGPRARGAAGGGDPPWPALWDALAALSGYAETFGASALAAEPLLYREIVEAYLRPRPSAERVGSASASASASEDDEPQAEGAAAGEGDEQEAQRAVGVGRGAGGAEPEAESEAKTEPGPGLDEAAAARRAERPEARATPRRGARASRGAARRRTPRRQGLWGPPGSPAAAGLGLRPFVAALGGLLGRLGALLAAPLAPARVYHALGSGWAGLVAALAARRAGVPLIVTEPDPAALARLAAGAGPAVEAGAGGAADAEGSGAGLVERLGAAAAALLGRLVLSEAARAVAGDRAGLALLYEQGLGAERGRAISRGVDLARFAGLRAQKPPPGPGRPFRVAYYGRFVPEDDLKTFVLAARSLVERLEHVELVAVGDPEAPGGAYLASCQLKAQVLGVERLLRFAREVGLVEVLAVADVIVIPAVAESEPAGLLEALAAGVPVVAADSGVAPRLLLGGEDADDRALGPAGLLAPIGDAEAFAEAVVRLAGDAERWRRLSAAGEARARRFYARDQGLRAYRALYADLAEVGGGGAEAGYGSP